MAPTARMIRDHRPHGVAWWLWTTGLAAAALRTTNPILLLGLGAVVVVVTAVCRSDAPWGRSIGVYLKLGLVVIALRVALQLVFGQRLPGHVLFTIPSVPLPGWAEGVSIGGPVTLEGLLTAMVGGMRLALVLVCFGAANSLASPREVLRSLPGILHEVAVAVTVALCFAPEVLESVRRVREARTLRGRPTKGLAGLRGIAIPVLEDALEHALQLAASMGARGFGRRPARRTVARSRLAMVAVVTGSLLALGGVYGILAPDSGVPMAGVVAALGAVIVGLGVLLSGRRSVRTRYRPAPFGPRSVLCVIAGWIPLVAFVVAAAADPAAIAWSAYPLAWPVVPVLALVGILAALAPLAMTSAAGRPEEKARRPAVREVVA